jgi:hypothetical protein
MTVLLRRSLIAVVLLTTAAAAQQPLPYWDYQSAMNAAYYLDHVTAVDTLEDEMGPYLAMGDRFGLVRLMQLVDGESREVWTSKQLTGAVLEVLSADLDGDDQDEIIAWTSSGVIYVWSSVDRRLRWESLNNDFRQLHCLSVGQVDEDEPLEIVVNGDRRIHYVDGQSFNREWTSPMEYEAGRIAIGDVDGDGTAEIVLNTGQVVDVRSGDVEWAGEVFGSRIVLLDMDGDGIPEVLSESDGTVMRIFDVDHRREKQLQ